LAGVKFKGGINKEVCKERKMFVVSADRRKKKDTTDFAKSVLEISLLTGYF